MFVEWIYTEFWKLFDDISDSIIMVINLLLKILVCQRMLFAFRLELLHLLLKIIAQVLKLLDIRLAWSHLFIKKIAHLLVHSLFCAFANKGVVVVDKFLMC